MRLRIDSAREYGDLVPEPKGRLEWSVNRPEPPDGRIKESGTRQLGFVNASPTPTDSDLHAVRWNSTGPQRAG